MAIADNGRKSMKFSIHNVRLLTNIRIVSVYGDYQYIVEIANFNIYFNIGNLLINSLYGATKTFASWFEMTFKRCVLEVRFQVNGLYLTYADHLIEGSVSMPTISLMVVFLCLPPH